MIITIVSVVALFISFGVKVSTNRMEDGNNVTSSTKPSMKLIIFNINGNSYLNTINRQLFLSVVNSTIKIINLSNNSIYDIDKNSFNTDQFSKVIKIDLSGNKLTILKSEDLAGLKSVTNIRLSYNNIRFILKNSLSHCLLLQKLFIDHNLLNKLPNNLFLPLHYLKKLDASFNKMNKLMNLGKLNSSLNWLSWKSNRLTDTTSMPNLPNIKQLNLKDNMIHNINDFTFDKTSKLEMLSLEGNKLFRLTQGVFVPLVKLRWLSLANNQLRTTPDYMFQANPLMIFIYLNNNKWTRINANTFTGFTNHLMLMDLQDNKLEKIDKNAFLSCQSLKYLYLKGNNLIYIEQSKFRKLRSLIRISFNGNPIICDCKLAWLKEPEQKSVMNAFLNLNGNNETTDGLLKCMNKNNKKYTVIEVLKAMSCNKGNTSLHNNYNVCL